ncbi:uncharacterized protein I303_102076 [Kwoniella dejecticola CBS 10117]|uniref:Uncharacterized protein n=1 Tax=Kwoniella dejecticola CBS 10117 TaxID=1296121 RepID=A0A1A6ABZ7_9TREE|nr:uncharacterized protein I303_01783 [Kwoniella dejecticola CBS 10117]OBR87575.1 hypothetical protein I303_01783 [Kwoniella dejecticola CBS 10117]
MSDKPIFSFGGVQPKLPLSQPESNKSPTVTATRLGKAQNGESTKSIVGALDYKNIPKSLKAAWTRMTPTEGSQTNRANRETESAHDTASSFSNNTEHRPGIITQLLHQCANADVIESASFKGTSPSTHDDTDAEGRTTPVAPLTSLPKLSSPHPHVGSRSDSPSSSGRSSVSTLVTSIPEDAKDGVSTPSLIRSRSSSSLENTTPELVTPPTIPDELPGMPTHDENDENVERPPLPIYDEKEDMPALLACLTVGLSKTEDDLALYQAIVESYADFDDLVVLVDSDRNQRGVRLKVVDGVRKWEAWREV